MSASKAFAFSLALLIGAGTQVSAQNSVVFDEPVEAGSDSSGSVSGSTPIGSTGGYFWVQGDFGERPGITGNNASFGSFAPLDFLGPNDRFFLDGQMMVNDNANVGASAGLGYRRLVEPISSILGVNGYYTYDESQQGFGYNQGGAGAEWLTDYFQVTANLYLPFDSTPNNLGPIIRTKNSVFQDNNLAFINIQNAEAQQRGADIEVGVPIPGVRWLSAHGGAYYLDAKNAPEVNGVRGRIQADLTNVLLNLSYANDDTYGGQVNFAATYLFGAQNGNYNPRVKSLYDRLNDRTRRTSRIATQQVVSNPRELAINPRTGLPWTFAHFDNTAAAGGNGSNNQRFNSLVGASPADALLFHRGTTTRTNPLTGAAGIVLIDNQLVFGEGCPTLIDVLNRPGGPCPLPGFDPAGTNPFVTAAAGNVFTLADNNRIAGLNIIAPTGGNAIAGTGINNFTLEKLNRNINPLTPGPNGTTGTGGGILLTNATGNGIIRDFGFNIPSTNGPSGIVINNTNVAPLTVGISDGRFLNGGQFGIRLAGSNSNITANINNVNNSASGTGLHVQATNTGNVVANVTNSSFNNAVVPVGDGIAVVGTTNGNVTLNATNVNATGAGRDGLRLDLRTGATGVLNATTVNASGAVRDGLSLNVQSGAVGTVVVNALNVSGAGDDAIFSIVDGAGSRLNLTATGVTGTGAGDDGYDFRTSNSAVLNAALSGGSLSGATDDGIVGAVSSGSTANLSVNGTNVSNAGGVGGLGNGLFVTTSGASRFVGTVTNSSLDSATENGVRLDTTGGSRSILSLTNSPATNAGANGLLVNTAGTNSRADVVLNNESFNGAGLDAINLNATTDSLIILAGNNVSGANAGNDGIQISANDSTVSMNLTNTGSFVSPNGHGINLSGTNTGIINLGVAGTPGAPSVFDGATLSGVNGVLNNASAVLNLTDVTFRNAGVDGLHLELNAGSTLTGNVANSNFSRPGPAPSGDDGLEVLLNASTATLNFTGTNVDNAGDDAIHIEANNASTYTTKFTGGSLVNAGGDMTDITFMGGSVVNFNLDPIATGANQNGLRFNGSTNSTLNAIISDSPMSVAGANNIVGQNGVLGTLDTNAVANLQLIRSPIAFATLDAIRVTAQGNSTFNANILDSSLQNAGQDGLDLTLTNATANVTFDNSDINNVGGDAIRVTGTNSRLNLNLNNGIALDNARGDAMEFNANTNSVFTIVGNQAVTATNALAGDGLRVAATVGSTVNATFRAGLSLDNANDNAIDLNGTNSTVNLIGQGLTTGANAGGDAIRLNGLNSTVTAQLLNAGTFAGAGGDGIDVTGDNSIMGVRFEGAVPGAANLDGAAGNGVVANLTNGSTGQFLVNNFSIQNSGLNGVDLNLDASRIVGSSFTNGQIDNSGQAGVPGSGDGLQIFADNGSNIGTRATNAPGLTLNNVTLQNDNPNARTQQNGLDVTAEGDSFVGATIIGATITQNLSDGVLVNINPDASLNDSSLAVLNFDNTNVNNNQGDGFHVRATNGTDDAAPPQLSGAIINFNNGEINQNGNFINPPPTGVIGDGIGDGIDAAANGDNTVAGNTQITFNLSGSDILGNEEMALNTAITNGGSVNLNINGGSIDGTLNIPCADGPLALINFSLINTNISAASSLILCAKNDGILNATISGVNFSGNPGQGIVILSETGGDITANLSNMTVQNNGANPVAPASVVNPPITTVTGAIQGLIDGIGSDGNGSTLTLNLNNLTVTNNQRAGLDLTVSNGADLITQITNSNFSDNGLAGAFDGMLIDVSGAGSTAAVNLNTVQANNATDDGFDFRASTGGVFNLTGQTLSAQSAAADGLSLLADGGTVTVDVIGLNATGADGNAVNLIADNAAMLAVDRLNTVVGTSAGQEGLNLDVLNGSTLLAFRTGGLNVNDSGRLNAAANGVDLLIDSGSTAARLNLTNVLADNAQGSGLQVIANDPAVTSNGLTLIGGSFLNAGNNGVDVSIANQAAPMNVVLRNVVANDANNYGALINVTNVTGGQSDIVLDNFDANIAGNDGVEINITSLGATDSTQLHILNGSSFNTATNEGVDINLDGAVGSFAELQIRDLTANTAGSNGISITATGGIDVIGTALNNISATNAGGTGLLVTSTGASGVRSINSNTLDVSGANGDGVSVRLDTQSTAADIRFNQLTAANAGLNGVDIVLDGVPGASNVALSNVTATGALNGNGVNLDAINMAATDSVTLSFNNVNVSNSSEDGLNMQLDGAVGSTATVNLDGLTATNNIRDGIDLSLTNGVAATVAQFDNVTSEFNGENGLKIDVASGSTLTSFTADGLALSDNGTSGLGFDGLDVMVHDAGSSAQFDLSNLTVNRSGGRGLDLDVFDNGTLTFNVTTGTIDRSGLGGIDANIGVQDESGSPVVVGPPGTFTGTFRDVTVTNSGQSPTFTADGVNFDVRGAGTLANVTLDHVISSNNDQDGFEINVNTGANGTFAVNNATTGNANNGTGFEFNADGAATTVSLISASGVLGDNTFNNNVGDPATLLDGPGVAVTLTNGVTATNLVIGASASGNDGDGLRILANDNTGVTINNFGISGTALTVNNNLGNGLLVDFNGVNGVTAFDLANMTVSGNSLDQIHAQFRNMSMENISLDTVTTTGTGAGTGDGIDIRLLDTQLTRLPVNGYAFSATNVVSTRNGGVGLRLNVDEALAPNAVATAGITNGLIRQSEFATNGGAGVQLTFGGDSVNNFDILNNATGFHNNGAEGILIEVQDAATYTMTGSNLVLPGAGSMYDNSILNNTGIGFHVVASEPLDVNFIVPDGIGPRVELNLGDSLRTANTITGNRDAAVAIEMSGDSTGSFNMFNSILTGTLNGANANFDGDGLAFILNNFAELETLTVDGVSLGLNISSNAGSGLVTQVNDQAKLGTLNRMTVLNTTIESNGLHGIDIQRTGSGLYGPDAANNQVIIGQFGQGNTIRNNTGNGLNILNANMPGAPTPFSIDVTGNAFDNNLNGIFLNATGNAQFGGNISDNNFDSNNRNGITVQLENDGSLGNPVAGSTPFLMAGNQILNSERHGIFFDTNSTNESGAFSGGAYVNVLIQDSLNAVDGLGNPVRTLISGSGQDGIHIEDNSDFFGSGATETLQNTYTIHATDVFNNGRDGISVQQAVIGVAIGNNSGIAINIGDAAAADQRDVILQGNGDDGLDIVIRDQTDIRSNLIVVNTTIQLNGATGDAEGGNGVEVDINNFGVLTSNFQNVDILQNQGNGMDWGMTSFRDPSAGIMNDVSMLGVNASQNLGVGLNILSTHDRGNATPNESVWNIGNANSLTAADVNRFNNNGRQGIVFDQQATQLSQATVAGPTPFGTLFDVNPDVYVETNLPFVGNNNYAPSTNHAVVTGGTFGPLPAPITRLETDIHLIDTFNLINSEVANNGATNNGDGLVLGIGSLTRMNSTIAGVSFGGNTADDIRIYPQRSSELNPANSVNNNPAATAGSAPLNQNFVVYDPVAYLDLVFGAIDTDGNGTPDTVLGNGAAATSGAGGTGAGDQITILTFGTNATAGITTDGVYTNADPAKSFRNVVLAGQVQMTGLSGFDDPTVNNFIQLGVQQDIANQFQFFNQNPASPFPDPVLP